MILGIVSNVWKKQLEHADLPDLIAEARESGLYAVELRQWSLGTFEVGSEAEDHDQWRPKRDALADLATRFPDVTFNLAIEWPFLSQDSRAESPRFKASIEAAKAVGGPSPILRLVDRSKVEQPRTDESPPGRRLKESRRRQESPAIAASLAELTRACIGRGVRLSVENSSQSIGSAQRIIEQARSHLAPPDKTALGVCVDPANQLLSPLTNDDPLEALAALRPDQIMLVHFKQVRGGQLADSVSSGDLDYQRFLEILAARSYAGPALFEIPPSHDIATRLQSSQRYIEELTRHAR